MARLSDLIVRRSNGACNGELADFCNLFTRCCRPAETAGGAARGIELEFELFDAIDGRKGLPPHLENQIDRQQTRKNIARDMTDAEYACALSHLAIYREVMERKLPGAILLEDDAILDPRFPTFYREGAYAGADMIIFDYRPCRVWHFSTRRLTADVSAARLSFCPCLTTGYGVSARGCSFMLENSFPLSRTADWPCDITQIGALAAIPRLVDHPPDEGPGSTI